MSADPVIEGSSIWKELMKMLYNVDAADNLFPSIHCLTSCFIAVRGNDKVPPWYREASLLIAVSICISALTTKQHVLIDLIALVYFAIQYCVWVNKIKGLKCENEEKKITWIL